MLLQSVDVFAAGCLGDKTIVVDSVDILFARNCVAETSAGTILVTDAPGFVAKRRLDVCSCVDIVVKSARTTCLNGSLCRRRVNLHSRLQSVCKDRIPLRHLYCAFGVAVLNYDDMVLLKEWAPHL